MSRNRLFDTFTRELRYNGPTKRARIFKKKHMIFFFFFVHTE